MWIIYLGDIRARTANIVTPAYNEHLIIVQQGCRMARAP
jgi:hypothetical protein